jgi:hypothetical protein
MSNYGDESGNFCCIDDCCGPGSWCCSRAMPHEHSDEDEGVSE